MAHIDSPITTPNIITVPANTLEHHLDFDATVNSKIQAQLGMKVRITAISAPVQFAVAINGTPDIIDASVPSFTTTDDIELTIHAGQSLRFKGAAGSETFVVII